VGASFNTADRVWLWSFDVTYDGRTFKDDTGARYRAEGVSDGAALPGSRWVRVDARRIKTKGGIVHVFDGQGRLAFMHRSSSEFPRIRFARDAAGRVVRISQEPRAGVDEFLFDVVRDVAGNVVTLRDRADRRAEFVNDAQGRVLTARDAFDVEEGLPGNRYFYSASRLSAWGNAHSEFVFVGYNGERVERIYHGYRTYRVSTYAVSENADGSLTTRWTDPSGAVHEFIFDRSFRIRSYRAPGGDTSSWEWSGFRPSSLRDATGALSRFQYRDDDLVAVHRADGSVLHFAYRAAAENRERPAERALREASIGDQRVLRQHYDAVGRLVARENGAGERFEFAYGSDGALTRWSAPFGSSVSFEGYGPHGQPTRIRSAGGVSKRSYDAVGNLISGFSARDDTATGRGGVISREYDADRNVSRVVLGSLSTSGLQETSELHITYRSDGQRLRIERPGFEGAEGGDTHFDYNGFGQLSARRERVDGQWHETRFEYDARGRRIRETRPNGTMSYRNYDGNGRLIRSGHEGGGRPAQHLGFEYAEGRLARSRDIASGEVEHYTYDSLGRLRTLRYADGHVLSLARDAAGRVAEARFLSGESELAVLSYSYDAGGRPVSVASGGAPLVERRYQAGRLVGQHYGNGLDQMLEYASDGSLSTTQLRDGRGTAFIEKTWRTPLAYSKPPELYTLRTRSAYRGVRATMTAKTFLALPEGFESPVASRLRRWYANRGARAGVHYAFDALGNRSGEAWLMLDRRVLEQPAPQYNSERNRLLRSADGQSYAYDEAGFVVRRGSETLGWNAAGQLLEVGASYRAERDAWGRLRREEGPSGERRFAFGGAVELDERGRPLALELGYARLSLQSGEREYRHHDERGHVVAASDAGANLVFLADYSPFGVPLIAGNAQPRPGFDRGRRAGPLLLLGARPYDPEIGRFLAPDPIHQAINQYAYTLGNPLWFEDADGENSRAAFLAATGLTVTTFAAGIAIAVSAPSVAVLTAGVGLATFASGFFLGLGSEEADPLLIEGLESVGAAAAFLTGAGGTTGPGAATLSGTTLGFSAGQGARFLIIERFPAPSGLRTPAPFSRGQRKELTLSVVPPALPAASGGGGCSPSALAGLPGPSSRLAWLVVLSFPAQLWLAWRVFGRRAANRRVRDG
jgi:RHS repeat-associated protein